MSYVALGVAVYLALVVHVGAVALLGAALGAQVEELRLAMGGGWVLRRAAPRITLGWVPGGWVRFVGADDPMAEGYHQLPAWRRVVIPLVGPLAVLLVAALLLGPSGALTAAVRAPAQVLAGLRPWSAAPAVIAAAATLLDQPATVLVGTVCAKLAAFNLLPLPALATGQALLVLLAPRERVQMGLQVAGLVVSAIMFGGWAIAAGVWILG